MPGTSEFAPVSSNSFFDAISDYLAEIERLGRRRVTSEAERAKVLADVNRAVADAQRQVNHWTEQALAEDFRKAYRNGHDTVLTPRASGISTNHRKRLRNNGISALADVKKWAETSTDVALAEANRAKLRKFIKAGKRDLAGGALSPSAKAKLQKQIADAEGLEAGVSARANRVVGDSPEVIYRRRKKVGKAARGTIAGRRNAREHFSMLAKTGHRDIINNAYLEGERARGVAWFLVSDGPDCGWTDHRGSPKANGMVVKYEDIIRSAHPSCQRGFVASGGPRSKKTKDLIAALTGSKDNKSLSTFVKSAAILGSVANIGLVVAQNPLVRQVVRDVLADTEIALSQFSKKILDRWVNIYERSEATVLAAQGREVNVLSRDALRRETLNSVENKVIRQGMDGNDLTRISISRREAQVLNLRRTEVLRGDLTRRLDDYADYIRHQTDASRHGLRNVSAAAQDETVIDVVFGEAAASARATWMGRGSSLISNAKRIHNIAEQTLKTSPERAELELIDSLARVLDPVPWLRVHLGQFRFSIGMPSDARAALARSLWKDMRGAEFRLKAEPTLAWRTYTPLRDRTISAQDIYDNLTPRITYFGRPIHTTIGLENGKLVPVFKLYPDQTFLNIFSFSAKVRSEKIADILAAAKELPEGEWPGFLKKQIKKLGEEPFFTIDAFRNGPIKFTARWQGSELDTLAVKFRPWDNKAVNYTHQLYRRYESLVPQKRHSITLVPKLDGGYTLNRSIADRARMKVLTGFTIARGSIVEAARVLGMDTMALIRSMDRWLRTTGLGIQELSKHIATLAKDGKNRLLLELDDIGDKLTTKLTQLADDFFKANKVDDIEEGLLIDVDHLDGRGGMRPDYERLDSIDEEIMVKSSVHPSVRVFMEQVPEFDRAMRAALAWWDDHPRFHAVDDDRPPLFVSSDWAKENLFIRNFNENAEMSWVQTFRFKPGTREMDMLGGADNYIIVPRRVMTEWADHSIMIEAQDLGWFNPRGIADNIGTIAHELGHHWSIGLATPRDLAAFWNATFRHPDIIKQWAHEPPDLTSFVDSGDIPSAREFMEHVNEWMDQSGVKRQIGEHISRYATMNAAELFAEFFMEIVTSEIPSHLASLARNYLRST